MAMEVSCAVEIFEEAAPGFVANRLYAPGQLQLSGCALDALDADGCWCELVQLACRRCRQSTDQHAGTSDSLRRGRADRTGRYDGHRDAPGALAIYG
jgi:hypothetical protein